MGKLDIYLETFQLPDTAYNKGRGKENLCPFCDKPHNGFPLFVNTSEEAPVSATLVISKQFACFDCGEAIARAEMFSLDLPNLRDSRDKPDSEESYYGKKQVRIAEYAKFGSFSSEAVTYNTPTRTYTDSTKFVNANRCYFCDSLSSYKHLRYIQVPAACGNYLTQANIPFCRDCLNKIDETKEIQVGAYEISTRKNPSDTCGICQKSYAVTCDEYQDRHMGNRLGKHMCTDCLYDTIRAGKDYFMRYKSANNCRCCGEMVPKDTTIAPKYQLNSLFCVKCVYDGKDPIYFRKTQKLGDTNLVLFYEENGYCIKRIVTSKGSAVVRTKKSVFEVIFDFEREFLIQMTLWPEQ